MYNIELLIDSETFRYRPAEKAEFGELYEVFLGACNITTILKTESERWGIGVCESAVAEVVERVRKRALNLYVYHGIDKLGELRISALYCYWVLQLQPFFWEKRHENNPNYELNAKVALRLFVNGVNSYVAEETDKAEKKGLNVKYGINMNREIFKNLYYSFRFKDWNEESLMDLAESLVTKK